MNDVTNWLDAFLRERDLDSPDGRPMYSYRTTADEFESLQRLLSDAEYRSGSLSGFFSGSERLFVLFAAEWWRRKYKGGAWKWSPIIDALGWTTAEYHTITGFVSSGLRYWDRPLRRQGDANAYLVSLLCEGGVPVNVLEGETSHLRKYLKAVLDDFMTFSGRGRSEFSLAESNRNLLPRSLQREGVYQLCSELVSVIYELAEHVQNRDKPVDDLNRRVPGWDSRLPFLLDSGAAGTIVNALLRQAKLRRSGVSSRLRISRRYQLGEGVLRPYAVAQLPESLAAEIIEQEIGSARGTLASRMELVLRTQARLTSVASLIRSAEDFHVYPLSAAVQRIEVSSCEWVAASVVGAGQVLGDLPVAGSEGAASGLPWVLAPMSDDMDAFELVGQGSCSSRSPTLVIAIPQGAEIVETSGVTREIPHRLSDLPDCALVEVQGSIRLKVAGGLAIRVRSGADVEEQPQFRMSGKYFASAARAGQRLFLGKPTISALKPNGYWAAVGAADVMWRYPGRDSQWISVASQEPLGSVDIRVVRDEECVWAARADVLPDEFGFSISSSDSVSEGVLHLQGVRCAVVGLPPTVHFDVTVTSEGDTAELSCVSKTGGASRVPVVLQWGDGGRCEILLPFPGRGARFTNADGAPFDSRILPLSHLTVVSAMAISFDALETFELVGQLIANDVPARQSRGLNLSCVIPRMAAGLHELALYQFARELRELFSYSTSIDAMVKLEIVSRGHVHSRCEVVQTQGELVFDSSSCRVSYTGHDEMARSDQRIGATMLSLHSFSDDSESAEQVTPDDDGRGWMVTDFPGTSLPALAALDGAIARSVRPCLVSIGESLNTDGAGLSLSAAACIVDHDARRAAYDNILSRLENEPADKDWPELQRILKLFSQVHPDALDLYDRLIEHPAIMASLVLRADADRRASLLQLEDYLPFRWWQIPLTHWLSSLEGYLGHIGIVAGEAVLDIVRNALTDNCTAIRGHDKNMQISIGLAQQLALGLEFQIKLFDVPPKTLYAALDDIVRKRVLPRLAESRKWPTLLDRKEAATELGISQSHMPWLSDDDRGFRRSFLDAPLIAAYASIEGIYLSREMRVSICAVRQFSPPEFDDMFKVAQAMFWKVHDLENQR